MQHGLEGEGGGGGGGGVSSTEDTGGGGTGESMEHGGQQLPVEAASPISSRPPAASSVNLDEYMAMSSGGGGSGGGGNRWPRQETLALLRIRSEMDTVFRDATLKGPLWEDVSRKLAELGYNRSGKKCKEKFENVHKYYKRTKEGRAGRQDGKTYKFFTELEALHATTTATQPPPPPPPPSLGVGISNPMPISSFRANNNITPPTYSTMLPTSTPAPQPSQQQQQPITVAPVAAISFSSNSSSSSPGSEDDDDDDDDDDDVFEGGPSNPAAAVGSSRKRKRDWSSRHSASTMEFFENLMKQVMQKQEAMQQRFLEVIEKREQDRMIRDEAWKRQEMARLTREHELMAQERTISASRDAAIISFLQKITGQTIHLPDPPPPPPPLNTTTAIIPNVTIHVPTATPIPPTVPHPPAPAPAAAAAVPPVMTQQHHDQQQQQQQLVIERRQSPSGDRFQTPNRSSTQQLVLQQQQQQDQTFTGGTPSSRWPKPEVLALIKLRSGLESKYQEAGPKGPLWEEISAEMQRMGYKRSPKRCKEKWENINKYFKKVKESNKQRPEDAKTCPYFHELDALYRKKIIGSGSIAPAAQLPQLQPPQDPQTGVRIATAVAVENQPPNTAVLQVQPAAAAIIGTENKSSGEATEKPEDIVMELMKVHVGTQAVLVPQQQQLLVNDYDRLEELVDSDDEDDEQDDEEDEDEDEDIIDHADEVERKMANYKMQLKRQSAAPSNGGTGNETPSSFLTMPMVQ